MEILNTILYYWGVGCAIGFIVTMLVFGPEAVRFFMEEYSLLIAHEVGEKYRALVEMAKRIVRPLLIWWTKRGGEVGGILLVLFVIAAVALGLIATSPV